MVAFQHYNVKSAKLFQASRIHVPSILVGTCSIQQIHHQLYKLRDCALHAILPVPSSIRSADVDPIRRAANPTGKRKNRAQHVRGQLLGSYSTL